MAFLFEYGNWIEISNEDELKNMLEVIWGERLLWKEETDNEESTGKGLYQPFIQFDGNKIRARNHSGFIQRADELIEIYPKVFRNGNCQDKSLMLSHVFYWLSYCRKWKFPFTEAGLNTKEIDSFPELIIHLITNQIYTAVANQPLAQYQAVEEALVTPRGSINFTRYINNSLSKSNFHQIECDHEPFLFDNKVNRIIKYCVRLLLNKTHLSENIRVLQEIVYILDEVRDIPCKIQDIESTSLNSFYEEYNQVLNSCRIILDQQLYSNTPYDMSQWCLLLPMEYIFEDFIAGFLETNFSDKWKVEYQKSNKNLTSNPEAFQMQHDIFLTLRKNKEKKIILDTKYKLREPSFKEDKKKGISQTDMYQVTSYAFRRGCKDLLLLYPNVNEELKGSDCFSIQSEFPGDNIITVTAAEVPFWSIEEFSSLTTKLHDFFSNELKKHE
jgi:5-methylcytosine-specific restriction enzyme subunit McrC